MDGTRIRLISLGLPAVALAALLSGCGAPGSDSGALTAAGDVFTLTVGHCLDDADATGEVTSVPIVDCAGPHDSEVFARTEVTGDVFPGGDALDTELDAFCQGEAFTEFVGIPFSESAYLTGGYYPTAASWERGDRELLCTIRAAVGRITGTLEGVAR